MAALFHIIKAFYLLSYVLLINTNLQHYVLAQQDLKDFLSSQISEGFLGNNDPQDQHQGNTPSNSFFFPFFGNPPSKAGDNRDESDGGRGVGSKPADNSYKNPQFDPNEKKDLETNFKGSWAIVKENSGVSAMHLILLPNNKAIMYDASAFRISDIKLPNGKCIPYIDKATNKQLQDCWSHGVEFDVQTSEVRPLELVYDPWCSSGGLSVDGTLVGTGGWDDGVKTVRYLKPCETCDFQEYQTSLADPRWYATQITLPDGGFLVVGGRRAYSYEIVPPPGKSNQKAIFLPLLDETTDMDENNLYPFVHLSTDGNVFIFANNRSVLLNPTTNKVLSEFPALDGGARSYPASGMSALLPLRLDLNGIGKLIPAEVIVCGGAKHEAYALAGRGTFIAALNDCNRLTITDPKAAGWRREEMPSRRVMGDMLMLPTGDLLILNGAKLGTAAWWFAEEPNLVPVLYRPDRPVDDRFEELKETNIPRMYHSSSAVLPDGQILVAGSNTNPGYNYTAKYPTELRVEKFSPPYLAPELSKRRPIIMKESAATELRYDQKFQLVFTLHGPKATAAGIKVTMYAPPFTTHGYSMNQRLLVLGTDQLVRISKGQYRIVVAAPPSAVLAPPGYYLVFVVHLGLPSEGIWVRIK